MKHAQSYGLAAGLVLSVLSTAVAQISLDQMIDDALAHAALRPILEYSHAENQLKLDNIAAARLPQLSVSGQATYQSDVTEIGLDLPGINIEPLSQYQYRLQGQISQNLYDGGRVKQRQAWHQINTSIADLELEMELDQIRLQTIQTYFTILELQGRQDVLQLKSENISANLEIVRTGVKHGMRLAAEADVLEVSLLQIGQQAEQLAQARNAAIARLVLLTGQPVDSSDTFLVPEASDPVFTQNDENLQHRLFKLRGAQAEHQLSLKQAEARPRLDFIVQGGYGRPGFNFLNNDFDFFGLVGFRGSWVLGSIYTSKNDRHLASIQRKKVHARQADFRQRLDKQIKHAQYTIAQTSNNLVQDQSIIDLTARIRTTAETQFRNGAINSTELLEKINLENEAVINQLLREIRLKRLLYELEHITGNHLRNKNN